MTQKEANPHAPAATPEHVAKLLAEASEVTSVDQGGQVEVQLGHFCNNRCVFCGSGQLTERGYAVPVPDAAVMRAIDAAASRGIRRMTFLGGEPTIQESFLPSLQHARALGVDDITIFTNGARTWDVRFLDAVLGDGPVHWRISIQGGDEASHDAIVGKKGAFRRIVRGLALLHERGQDVTVNMCLTSGALEALPRLAAVVVDNGVRQLCVDMVRPVSAGDRTEDYLQGIIPRFSDVAPALRALLAEIDARAPGFDVNLTHVPYCVMPDEAHRLHHGGEPTITFTADLAERQGAMDKYAFQASDRSMMPQCAECIFEPRCTGVPHVYRSWHGDAEFVPVRAEDLPRLDPQQNAFVDGLRARVSTLQGAEVVADARQRRVELRAPGGTSWLLPAASPLPAGLWEIASAEGWRLAIEPGRCTPRGLLHGRALARQLDSAARDVAVDLRRAARLRAWLERAAARMRPAEPERSAEPPAPAVPTPIGSGWQHGALRLTLALGIARQTVLVVPTPEGERPLAFEVLAELGVDEATRAALSGYLGAQLRESR
ncbi:MAG: hypothetical protein RIT45_1790 [Pseudomonadota bacterium]